VSQIPIRKSVLVHLNNSWDTLELLSITPNKRCGRRPAHLSISRHSFSDFNKGRIPKRENSTPQDTLGKRLVDETIRMVLYLEGERECFQWWKMGPPAFHLQISGIA
jgi:hypothetical protein